MLTLPIASRAHFSLNLPPCDTAATIWQNSRMEAKRLGGEIKLSEFLNRLKDMDKNEHELIEREFEALNRRLMDPDRKSMAESEVNMKKNRFMDVLPFDENRVKISKGGYINASFIEGYNGKSSYIASQGPIGENELNQGKRESTVADFWDMIWEHQIECIVMLTQVVENLRLKCAQYWPSDVDDVFEIEGYKVTLVDVVEDEICIVRNFCLSYNGSSRRIAQWHFKEWHDSKAPQSAAHLLEFIYRLHQAHDKKKAPMLVHCSAGVGRTGVFIALDILLQHIAEHDSVDVFACVRKLREQRVRMVQTVEQYIVLYDAIAVAIQMKDEGRTISAHPDNLAPSRTSPESDSEPGPSSPL